MCAMATRKAEAVWEGNLREGTIVPRRGRSPISSRAGGAATGRTRRRQIVGREVRKHPKSQTPPAD